jgi:mono/diheme cytochrome c family protein
MMRNLDSSSADGLPIKALRRILVILALVGAALFAFACATGEPEGSASASAARGETFARSACAECHAVGAGEFVSPNAAAPAFQALADRADMSRSALAVLLSLPHKSMPNYIIASDDVAGLSAYLSSIRR